MPGSFLDTNVFVYFASGDRIKADRAESLLRDGGASSVQVLNALANVARRKMRMSWADTRAFLTTLCGLLKVHPLTLEIHETGLRLAEQHNLAIYDAMIFASALAADCDTLWSEDMHDGMCLGGKLRVINPFH